MNRRRRLIRVAAVAVALVAGHISRGTDTPTVGIVLLILSGFLFGYADVYRAEAVARRLAAQAASEREAHALARADKAHALALMERAQAAQANADRALADANADRDAALTRLAASRQPLLDFITARVAATGATEVVAVDNRARVVAVGPPRVIDAGDNTPEHAWGTFSLTLLDSGPLEVVGWHLQRADGIVVLRGTFASSAVLLASAGEPLAMSLPLPITLVPRP